MTRTDLFEKQDSLQALQLLKDGNQRYVHGERDCLLTELPELLTEKPEPLELVEPLELSPASISETRHILADKGQAPFAVILGCSDSRVPPEIVFDVSLGQLFVVRTAGNVADAIATGSVEYAVEHLGVQLVLVMGHSQCGAVAAAVAGGEFSPNIKAIVEQIEPSLMLVREGHMRKTATLGTDATGVIATAANTTGVDTKAADTTGVDTTAADATGVDNAAADAKETGASNVGNAEADVRAVVTGADATKARYAETDVAEADMAETDMHKASAVQANNIHALCEDENIRHTISMLMTSQVLREAITAGHLQIVGAKYDLATGQVDFWV